MTSANRTNTWVMRSLTSASAMVASFALVIFGATPAHAGEDFTPNPAVVNDPAGVSQDWFTVQSDGTYTYYWDAAMSSTSVVPQGTRVYTTAGSPFTIYVRHYTGTVKTVPVNVTNAAGASVPNTVTFTNASCAASGAVYYTVTWNQVYDGSGLESYRPIVVAVSDSGLNNRTYQVSGLETVADGQGFAFDAAIPGGVGLLPGWYTVYAGEYRNLSGTEGTFYHQNNSVRVWVPACAGVQPPSGQVPPGGVVPPPTNPNNPGAGQSGTPTGKLKFLARKGQVQAKTVNKLASLSIFKLKRPGAKPIIIKAPAKKVVVKRVKALKPGKYRLMAPVWKDGKVVDYVCVDTLKLVRKR